MSDEGFNTDQGEDALIQFHPDAEKRAYLKQAGKYGPGLQHEADCEIKDYRIVSKELIAAGQCDPKNAPAFDKDCEKGPYALLYILVKSAEMGLIHYRHHEPIGAFAGSNMPRWLNSLNVPLGPPPTFDHNRKSVVGLKCGIEVLDPRTGSDGKKYNGNLKDIFGV